MLRNSNKRTGRMKTRTEAYELNMLPVSNAVLDRLELWYF